MKTQFLDTDKSPWMALCVTTTFGRAVLDTPRKYVAFLAEANQTSMAQERDILRSSMIAASDSDIPVFQFPPQSGAKTAQDFFADNGLLRDDLALA